MYRFDQKHKTLTSRWFSYLLFFVLSVGGIYAAVNYTEYFPNGSLLYQSQTNGWVTPVVSTKEIIIWDGSCKRITSTQSEIYFIPTKTQVEWDNFVANPPSGVSIAGCVSYVASAVVNGTTTPSGVIGSFSLQTGDVLVFIGSSWTDWGLSSPYTNAWTQVVNKAWESYGYSEDVYYTVATSNGTTGVNYTYAGGTFNHGIVYQIRGTSGVVTSTSNVVGATSLAAPAGGTSGMTITWVNDRSVGSPAGWTFSPASTYVTAPTSAYFSVKTGYRIADNSAVNVSGVVLSPYSFIGLQVNVR